MTSIYALVVFDIACGIPCEHIEVKGPYDTLEQCWYQYQPTKHHYLMTENKLVWTTCIREGGGDFN